MIVAVVAIVARSAHGWRTGSLFGLGLLLFIGALAVGCADRSANNGAHVRTVDYSISEESAAAMSGFPGAPHSEAQFLAPRPIVGAELSWLGILLILVVAAGGVVLVRHRGAAGSSLAALVLLGFGTFMLLTLFWVRSSPTPQWPQMAATPNAVPVVVPNRFDAYESPDFEDVVELDHGRPMGEQQSEPIDELYERFSKPRIPLDEPEGAAEDPSAHEATSVSEASDTAGAVEDEGAKDGPSQAQALVASAAAVADHAAEHDHDHADEGAVAIADAAGEPAQAHDGAHLSTPPAASADPHTGAATDLPDWADQPTLVVGNVRRVTVEAGPY
ncbi:MAG TPA: hypothetical protein VEQ85_13485, partial [Lacipirellulaceae bacterium]|nr:hypothetical protein [Lacipirellulaceae bacterium]